MRQYPKSDRKHADEGLKPRESQETKWFLARIFPKKISIYFWNEAEARRPGLFHLCGQGCVSVLFEQWAADN